MSLIPVTQTCLHQQVIYTQHNHTIPIIIIFDAVSCIPAVRYALENASLIGLHSYAVSGLALQVVAGTPKQAEHGDLNVVHGTDGGTPKQAECGYLNVLQDADGVFVKSPVKGKAGGPQQTQHGNLNMSHDADGMVGLRSSVRKGWQCSGETDVVGKLD